MFKFEVLEQYWTVLSRWLINNPLDGPADASGFFRLINDDDIGIR